MNWKAIIVVIVSLFFVGLALRPIEGPAWNELKEREPALRLADLEAALGQGVTIGLLGGFRAVVADLLWIRTNVIWEEQDAAVIPTMETMIRLVTTIDPRPVYFWLNGSRIIAYDMAAWRVREAGDYGNIPETAVQRYHDEQAETGIRLLERGREYHPDSPELVVDIANIYLRRMENREMAAEYYRIGAEMENAPPFVARIYAEILRQMGENRRAYDWLVDLYPTLDPANPRDQRDRVLGRIRELEDVLEIPATQRFRPEF